MYKMNWFKTRWQNEGAFKGMNIFMWVLIVLAPFVSHWLDLKYFGSAEWDFTGTAMFGGIYVVILLITYLKRNSE